MDLNALKDWATLAGSVVAILVSLGAAALLRSAVLYYVNRSRWNDFDVAIQEWLQGKGASPPKELTADEWKCFVATCLKDAGFAPDEALKLLDYATAFARGRYGEYDVREIE